MLSKSCIRLVQLYFEKIENVKVVKVSLGFAEMEYDVSKIKPAQIEKYFDELGFTVVKDPDVELVERCKVAAVELIHYAYNTSSLIRNSEYISDRLQMPYEKISKIFSRVTNTTLEKYIILLKIEKAKELILSAELSLSEISYMLGYSSVHYLSNQFKKITGVTVSEFKENSALHRIPIEDLI